MTCQKLECNICPEYSSEDVLCKGKNISLEGLEALSLLLYIYERFAKPLAEEYRDIRKFSKLVLRSKCKYIKQQHQLANCVNVYRA